jgi:hypothetical protein
MRFRFLVPLLVIPAGVDAQVGHRPSASPYRDLEYRQELTFFGGSFSASEDPARVAARSGPMGGVHWEYRVGGPAYLTARFAGVLTDRREIDPRLEADERFLGEKSVFLTYTDVGFALNLTGYKSWRGFIPTLGGGLGLGAAFDSRDSGGFSIGTPFLLSLRPGLKFGVGGRWHGRIDASNYFHRVRYPETYFIKTGADDPVLDPGAARNYWKRHVAFTLGATYSFGR